MFNVQIWLLPYALFSCDNLSPQDISTFTYSVCIIFQGSLSGRWCSEYIISKFKPFSVMHTSIEDIGTIGKMNIYPLHPYTTHDTTQVHTWSFCMEHFGLFAHDSPGVESSGWLSGPFFGMPHLVSCTLWQVPCHLVILTSCFLSS